jgi:FixJ family two-component response regulator
MAKRRDVVAILDDDTVIRHAIANLLKALDYRTELYASAEEFLEAEKSEASCLVIDVHLGDISGIELGRQLAANGYKSPIIFMTASDDQSLRRQAMEFGCVAYLQKPLDADRLVEAIMTAVKSPAEKATC